MLNDRRTILDNQINDIRDALLSESKSSAGDKHETGRAVLQLEREKLGFQLAELEKHQAILNRVNLNTVHHNISLGSVVKTSLANYFISISAGQIEVEDIMYYAISSDAPIAKSLIGKKQNDSVVFNHQNIEILEVI
ncbi:MAG: 3-oxoacyl-ACP synthase [Bacteroidia bacterium]|nr:3-oxoacyl-ACP synthase [Bacteroidia bacterium]